jgi:hypothetical protein
VGLAAICLHERPCLPEQLVGVPNHGLKAFNRLAIIQQKERLFEIFQKKANMKEISQAILGILLKVLSLRNNNRK